MGIWSGIKNVYSAIGGAVTDTAFFLPEVAANAWNFCGGWHGPEIVAGLRSIHEWTNVATGIETPEQAAKNEVKFVIQDWLTNKLEDWGIPAPVATILAGMLGGVLDMIINAVTKFGERLLNQAADPSKDPSTNPVEKEALANTKGIETGHKHVPPSVAVEPPAPTPHVNAPAVHTPAVSH